MFLVQVSPAFIIGSLTELRRRKVCEMRFWRAWIVEKTICIQFRVSAGWCRGNQPTLLSAIFFAWRSACVLLCVMRRVGASCWHAKSPSHLSLSQSSKTPKKNEGENESRVPSAGPGRKHGGVPLVFSRGW